VKSKKKKEASNGFFEEEVLRIFVQHPRQKFNYKQIAHRLGGATADKKAAVKTALIHLMKANKIVETSRGKFQYALPKDGISGTIDFNRRGAAYVTPEEGGKDIYIPPPNTLNALQGDEVEVKITGVNRRGQKEGMVRQVIKRNKKRFVGIAEVEKDFAFVIPDDPSLHVDFFIPSDKIGDLKDDDKVLVELVDWPTKAKNPYGRVVEIFGQSGENSAEMHAIVAEFGFDINFEPAVEKAAENLPKKISKEEIAQRRDFRKTMTFTIDPADAKDFDDALSYRELDNGHVEVGVHIADVSHYVTRGSIIDQEAEKRGTSVYLVDRTIPMLPEVLSNELCSLRPHEESLCYAAIFELDDTGKVFRYDIEKTVIFSDQRFAYEDAQALIENPSGKYGKPLVRLNNIAKKLKKQRFKEGSINFESTEIKFDLNEEGKPVGIITKERKDAHKMIEEFMLLANKTIARHVATKVKMPIPYRVHETPRDEKMAELVRMAKRFNHTIKTESTEAYVNSINTMMKAVEGTIEADILRPMAIRSMEKAYYTTQKTSHFGLAFSHYCHFTSPIRRYPDLLTHRYLHAYLKKEKIKGISGLEKLCDHSSKMEQKAVNAERASIKYKQTEYLSDQVGNEFEGIISGMTDYGIFVEIIENKCEGMVRMRDIRYDRFYYNEKDQKAVGKRTGIQLKLGDIVTVEVKKTDLNKRTIDLDLVF
jgi:ribonuclease R